MAVETDQAADPPVNGMRRTRVAGASVVLVTLLYAGVAFVLLKPDAPHSIDATVKFIQARALLDHRFTASDIPNRGSFLDPEGRFFPLSRPYVFRSPSGWQSIFPTAGALVQAPFSPWGMAGVTIPAVLSAALLMWVAWRFGRSGPGAGAIPAVIGLATILWFYATSPNEHALSAALTTAALFAATRERARWMVAAGLMLGLAATLRDEALLVAPGLVIARWLVGVRRPRPLVADSALMAVMALVPLVAVAVLDGWVYHRPVSAHLLHAVASLQRWLPADAVRDLPALPIIPWEDRPDVLIHQWLVGVGTWGDKAVALAALLAAIALRKRTGSVLGLLAVLGWLAVWRVVDVAELTTAPKFVGGLFRLCPFVVFALVPLPRPADGSIARRLSVAACAAYLCVAFFGLNTVGGKSFGPRLLFPMLPLLAVAATQSIAAWLGRFRTSRLEGAVGAIGALLVAVSMGMQFGVALPAWAIRNRGDYMTVARIEASRDRIVVVDHVSAVQMTAPFYFDRVVYLLTSQRAADVVSPLFERALIGRFSVLSRSDEPPLTFPRYVLDEQVADGHFASQRWRR